MEENNNFKANQTSQNEPEYLKQSIAIVGMSGRFPGANNVDEFWDILANGRYTVTRFPEGRPKFNVFGIEESVAGFLSCGIDEFDAEFFKIPENEAWAVDPQQRLLHEVVWEAIEDAGIDSAKLKGSRTGVFVGNLLQDYERMLPKSYAIGISSEIRQKGNALSALSSSISNFFQLSGPSLSHEAGCSSGLGVVHLACENILFGKSEMAIVGGVNLVLLPRAYNTAVLSSDFKCKTFDESADGFVSGETVGAIILKKYHDAVKDGDRIRAIIRGTAISNDGASQCYGTPNPTAHSRTHKLAMKKADVTPNEVQYIETHGTGTQKGDIGEVFGLYDAYGNKRDVPLIIGSVKPNIGHGEAAAAIASIIKLILSLEKEIIPANIFLRNINPKMNINQIPAIIPTESMAWDNEPRIAGCSSFSLTGSLVHAILQSAPILYQNLPLQNAPSTTSEFQLVVISAKTKEALDKQLQNYLQFCKTHRGHLSLEDVAYATNVCRTQFSHRIAIVSSSVQDLIQKIQNGKYLKNTVSVEIHDLFRIVGIQSEAEFEEIALRYVNGECLDWSDWFGKRNKKIFLPFYPFQRKKYWFDFKKFPAMLLKKEHDEYNGNCMSTLLGCRIPSPDKIIYQNDTSISHIVPSLSNIIAILVSVASYALQKDEEIYILENLYILTLFQPMALIQTILREVEEEKYEIELYSYASKKDWKLHAKCEFCNKVTKYVPSVEEVKWNKEAELTSNKGKVNIKNTPLKFKKVCYFRKVGNEVGRVLYFITEEGLRIDENENPV